MKEFFIKRRIERYTRHVHKHLHDPIYLEKLGTLCVQVSQKDLAVQYYQSAIDAYYRDDSLLGEDKEFILSLCWQLREIDALNILAWRTLGEE